MSPAAAILLFYAFYAAVGVMMVLLVRRLNATENRTPAAATIVRTGWQFAVFSPLLFAFVVPRFLLSSDAFRGPLLVLVAAPHAFLLGALWITSILVSKRDRALKLTAKDWIMACSSIVMVCCGLALVDSIIAAGTGRWASQAHYLWPWAIPVALGFAAFRWCRTMERAAPVLMEATTVEAELKAIAAHFGYTEVVVYALPMKSNSESGGEHRYERMVALHQWLQKFDPRRPTIPIELLTAIDPSAITAALSVNYARRLSLPRRLRWLNRTGLVRRPVRSAFVWLGVFLISIPIGMSGFAPAFAVTAIIALLAIAVFAIILLSTVWTAFRSRRALSRGFDAWKQADSSGTRTPEDFLVGLMEFDTSFRGFETLADTLSWYKATRPVLRFIRDRMSKSPNEVFEELALRVNPPLLPVSPTEISETVE